MGCLTLEEQEQYADENMKLVHFIASKYRNTGLEYEDLFSCAMLGFTQALKTFDKTKNFKFSTYASRCAINEILKHLQKSKRTLKTVSMDKTIETDEGSGITILDMIANPEREIDWRDISPIVQRVASNLKGQRKTIFRLFLENIRQAEIARMLNISRTHAGNVVRETLKLIHDEYWREEGMTKFSMTKEQADKLKAEGKNKTEIAQIAGVSLSTFIHHEKKWEGEIKPKKGTTNQEYDSLMNKLKEELQPANKDRDGHKALAEKLQSKIDEYEEVVKLKDEQNLQLVRRNQQAVAQIEKLQAENRNLHAAADDIEREVAVAKKMIRKEQEYMMDIEKYKNSARYVMEENKILSKTNEDLRIRINRMEEKYGLATALLKAVL